MTFFCSTEHGGGHRFIISNVKSYTSAKEKEGITRYNGPEFDDLTAKSQEAMDEFWVFFGLYLLGNAFWVFFGLYSLRLLGNAFLGNAFLGNALSEFVPQVGLSTSS